MLLSKVMNEYLIQELSIDEIKSQLLYYVNNNKNEKAKEYNRKILNYIFRK